MIRRLLLSLLLMPVFAFGQNKAGAMIKIEVKPVNPKESYTFEIRKTDKEIEITFSKVDSAGKIDFPAEELSTISALAQKEKLDSVEQDLLYRYQLKLDSIKKAAMIYKRDSTTVYKNTHKNYWDFLERIFNTPDQILTEKQEKNDEKNGTYSFFTLLQNKDQEDRYIFIDSLNPKVYPLLVKLLRDTEAIMKAHQVVMQRKN